VKKAKFTEEQFAFALKRADTGTKVALICLLLVAATAAVLTVMLLPSGLAWAYFGGRQGALPSQL
jgi:hypothetical protein